MSSNSNFTCVSPIRDYNRIYDDATMRAHKDAIKEILRSNNKHGMPLDFENEVDPYVKQIVAQYAFPIGVGRSLDPETKRCYVRYMAFYLGTELNQFSASDEQTWITAEKVINYLL
jgi:hypothetical protein